MPTYPEKPEGTEDKDPMRGLDLPWSTQLVWALTAGAPGELWCGTIPGGLFRSDDGGDNWNLVRSLWDEPRRRQWMGGGYDFAGIHSVLVDPRDPAHVTIAVSVGGERLAFGSTTGSLWISEDRGDSWHHVSAHLPPVNCLCFEND
ncbi:MAG: hypothetical protein LJE70_03910 [Chromatiaceae bacterium]|nr:hypothetical protein [Chromatiaceae bacterium]